MATYNVKCPNETCENHNEVIEIKKSMKDDFPLCESCGTMVISHFEAAPSFKLKGGGWTGKIGRR